MSKFRYHPTLLDRAQRMMKAGIWKEPLWYEGLRRSPPQTYGIAPKDSVPKIKFEEDKFYKNVLAKKPLLKLQQINPYQLDGNLAWQFARHQHELMRADKQLSENQAYQLTENHYKDKFEEFYNWLDESRMNYRMQMEQKEREGRAQASIMSEILERKLNVRDIFEHPMQKSGDSLPKRMANLQRLHADPGITAVKRLYSIQELPIIQALTGLLQNRKHEDADKYNLIIKNYIVKANSQFDGVYGDFDGDMKEIEELKDLLSDITLRLTYTPFVELTHQEKSSTIRVVQLARKCKVVDDYLPVKKVEADDISTLNEDALERNRLKSLKDDLDAASFLSDVKHVTTKDPDWLVFREEEWYRRSAERKYFVASKNRMKQLAENSGKMYK